jgi:hypothetical protein
MIAFYFCAKLRMFFEKNKKGNVKIFNILGLPSVKNLVSPAFARGGW